MVSHEVPCDTARVDTTAARQLPEGRRWFVDDQGVALRATWRLERGFVNLSLWEHDACTATFHLTPADAANLMSFLAQGLADATSVAAMAPVHALPDPPAATEAAPPTTTTTADRVEQAREQLAASATATRSHLGRALERLATRVTPD